MNNNVGARHASPYPTRQLDCKIHPGGDMRLAIGLLGPFTASLDGQPITEFESVKVRALLAFLAVENARPHRRESLATLLWPDWPQQSAMRNLRNALADLRKNIGDRETSTPFLLVTREAIQ